MQTPNNPYQTPQSAVETAPQGTGEWLPGEPRAVPVGNAITWLSSAWDLFKAHWGMLVVLNLVFLGLNFVSGFIPLLGQVLSIVLSVFLPAGIMLAIHRVATGESERVDFNDLFKPFSTHVGPLVGIAVLYFVALIVAMLIGGILAFLVVGSADIETLSASPTRLMLVVLVVLACIIPVVAAVLYSPYLAVLGNLKVMDALTRSLRGVLRNWLPLLVNGVIMGVLALISIIPLGLGLLVLLPFGWVVLYMSMRDIFQG